MIITLGKELPKGFSHNVSYMSYKDIDEALGIMKEKIPREKKLISISITPISEMDFYIPTILKYSNDTAPFLDPKEIFVHCVAGDDNVRPNADFVIFDKSDNVACLSYSKEAPVICFEGTRSNKKCIGTILRCALTNEKIIDRTFKKILDHLQDSEVKVTVALATHYVYEDMGSNLIDHISKICQKYKEITECNTKITVDPQQAQEKFYSRYENNRSNNAVILW